MHIISSLSAIIKWCNENVGFATIVLPALTLLVSIIVSWYN